MANVSKTKVITGKNTRLSYFHGWEPTSINGGPERYSVSVLIPKDDKETVKAIQMMQTENTSRLSDFCMELHLRLK